MSLSQTISNAPDAAALLFHRSASRGHSSPDRVDRPAGNPGAEQELQEPSGDLHDALPIFPAAASDVNADALSVQAYRELVSVGMAAAVARTITKNALLAWKAMSAPQAGGFASFRRVLVECIIAQLQFAPAARSGKDANSVLVFAGPPGAGKSTTLTKIAMTEFLDRRIPVRIISVDPHHAACHERMRALAGIIGAQFDAANTMAEFHTAVRHHSGRGGLLIDAAGYGVAENQYARELAGFLRDLNPRQTQIVLPAWMLKDDLVRVAREYNDFAPDYLLFTKVDETESYGSFLSAAIELRKPLSFLASGQNIPEDLGLATPSALFASLFHGQRVEAAWTTESTPHFAAAPAGADTVHN